LTIRAALLAALVCLWHTTATAALFSSEWKVVTNLIQRGEFPASLKTLELDNRLGALRVTGTDAAPFGWSWALAVRAQSPASGHRAAAKATCVALQNNDQLRLVVSLPDTDGKANFQSDIERNADSAVELPGFAKLIP
jgi:hypothetical protein